MVENSKIRGGVMKLLIIISALLVISCSNQQSTEVSPQSVVADPVVKNSFGIQNRNVGFSAQSFMAGQLVDVENRADISIEKSALDKEFLLHTQIIQQPSVPMFSNLKSRVVAFKLVDDSLYMLEANKGHQVTKDLPQTLILARFPVIEQTETSVTFDFNQGMNEVIMAGDWRGHRGQYKYDVISIENKLTYIEQAYVDSKNNLVIRQLGRLSALTSSGLENTPVEMKYYLTPYVPSENFQPTLAPVNMDKKGFFEIAPQYDDKGYVKNYASKHNMNKPIVYAVSSNTPKEFVDAVKQGALYWNRYFDKNVIEVVTAPEGRVAPDSEYNIIQWVPWEAAGFAYADAQMDPRTGEIRHAQVFMTSVFAVSGKTNAVRLLEAVSKGQVSLSRGLPITLEGFESQQFCHYEALEQFVTKLQSLLAEGADDAAFLNASKDYVREVMAHEVGHTMGLRHNFAGSLESNIPTAERMNFYKDYFEQTLDLETVYPGNSVMEYQPYIEAVITGDLIEKTQRQLNYDKLAIRALYYQEKPVGKAPLFCTDDHTSGDGAYNDCVRFDSGKNLAEGVASDLDAVDLFPVRVIDTFVKLKANLSKDNVHTVETLPLANALNATEWAKRLLEGQSRWLSSVSKNARLLSVHRSFAYVDDTNKEQVKQAQYEWAQKQVLNYGHKNLTPTIESDWAQKQFEKFEDQLLNKQTDQALFEAYGKPDLAFTDDEKSVILMKAESYYKLLQQEMVRQQLSAFSQVKFGLNNISLSYQPVLGDKLKSYLLSSNGFQEYIYVDQNKHSKTIKVPQFTYEKGIRNLAMTLLASDIPNWMVLEKKHLKSDIEQLLKDTFGEEKVEDIHTDQMSPYLASWYEDVLAIYGQL